MKVNMSVEMPNVKTRYFKLPFMGMYFEVTLKKIENFVKDLAKMSKLNQFSL